MSNKEHNKGQSDGASGKYNPPHSILDGFLDIFDSSSDKMKEHDRQNKDYDKGWRNGDKNRK